MRGIHTRALSLGFLFILGYTVVFGQDNNWKKYPYELIGGFGPSAMLGELGGGNGVGRNNILDYDFLSTRFGGNIGIRKTFRERVSWQATYSVGMIFGDDAKTKEYFRNDRAIKYRTPLQEVSFRIEYKIRKEREEITIDITKIEKNHKRTL